MAYIRTPIAFGADIVVICHSCISIINTDCLRSCMHDVIEESARESTYECLQCGKIVERTTHPRAVRGRCADHRRP